MWKIYFRRSNGVNEVLSLDNRETAQMLWDFLMDKVEWINARP